MENTVSERLSGLLKTSGMSENDLAKAAGVEYTTVHRIVTGETENPRKNSLIPLAKALNVSVEYLYSGKGAQESELSLLKRALNKLEEQLDRKDAMIEKLMNQVFPKPVEDTALDAA